MMLQVDWWLLSLNVLAKNGKLTEAHFITNRQHVKGNAIYNMINLSPRNPFRLLKCFFDELGNHSKGCGTAGGDWYLLLSS